MKNPVIAISSPYVVITTLVYALLAPIFFEMDNNNAFREEGANFVVTDKRMMMMMYSEQQQVYTKDCKSPCPESAEMCIAMCA
jgi:hypothetical protein